MDLSESTTTTVSESNNADLLLVQLNHFDDDDDIGSQQSVPGTTATADRVRTIPAPDPDADSAAAAAPPSNHDDAVVGEIRKLDLKGDADGDEAEVAVEVEVEKRGDDVAEVEGEKSSHEGDTEKGDGNESNEEEEEIKSENGDEIEKKGGEESNNRRIQFPLRPGAEDCSFYLKTGNCKFGSNCRFNHPVRRKPKLLLKDMVKERDESVEKPGQTECKYYSRPGGCKYGKGCRYNHEKGNPFVAPVVDINFLGLPIREGERECPYYMRTGSCKYGSNCRFNHPDPTAAGGSDPPSGFDNGGPASLQGGSQSSSWSAPKSLNETPLYVPMMMPPSQGVPSQNTEWNGYQAPVYLRERSMPAPPLYVINNSGIEANVYKQYPPPTQVDEFPERPGQPVCNFYLRTGECKFRSNCKYHHPKAQTAETPLFALSDNGLPLRPGQNICTHYSRYGICKFGPACKYDHPLHLTSSTTSGPDHQLPFSDFAYTQEAGIARSRNGTDDTIQLQQTL